MLASLKSDLAVLAQVNGKIMPTRLVKVIVAGFHSKHLDFLIKALKNPIAIGIEFVIHSYIALDVILRDIQPKAESAGIFKHSNFAVMSKSYICVFACIRCFRMQPVSFKTQGVISAVNLTISAISQRESQIIIPDSSLSVVCNIPFINIILTTLKVPKNHRSFSKLEVYSSGRIRAHI